MSKRRNIPVTAKVSYGNSQGYNWVHDPFSEELPFKKAGEKKDKMNKYSGHDYKRGKRNG
jgi:hypothetical protein